MKNHMVIQEYCSQMGGSSKTGKIKRAGKGLISVGGDAAGSAPGSDGQPYEVLPYGINCACRLIGQAFYAAERAAAVLGRVLGPTVDIRVWIP